MRKHNIVITAAFAAAGIKVDIHNTNGDKIAFATATIADQLISATLGGGGL